MKSAKERYILYNTKLSNSLSTTLDNPGWLVTVDPTGTAVETAQFAVVERADSQRDADWIVCKSEGARFVGAGGADNLEEILTIFLGWIDKSKPPDANARAD